MKFQDMQLAESLASAKRSPMPMGLEATQIYEQVLDEDPSAGDKDFSAVYRHLRLEANR